MIVVNETWRMAPWADAVYAMDAPWWRYRIRKVRAGFPGLRVTASAEARSLGLIGVRIRGAGNSGAGALLLAQAWGAARVIMLGYDACRTGGRAHWHEDHPDKLGNAKAMPNWPRHFAEVAKRLRVPVVNASRVTAIKAFPRGLLDIEVRG